MIRLAELKLPLSALQYDPENHTEFHPDAKLRALAAERLGIAESAIAQLNVHKRSFDARQKAELLAVYIVDLTLVDESQEAALLTQFAEHSHVNPTPDMSWTPVGQAPADLKHRPVVVGFGPCGMFAALVLAQMGFKPIVLERGKTVRERTKDTWRLWRKRELSPESNVQYGEGGAGTFSDGKLYSQIKDPRHLGRKVLTEFVTYGAPPEILYAAHPHIGTFKLVKLVEGIREEIVRLGGEIRFEQRVTDLHIAGEGAADDARHVTAIDVLNQATGESYTLETDHVVMALGHSARDTFAMFYERGVYMEAKPFSVGFRIEHPQSVIDKARWGKHAGHPLLGAADYKLVHHAKNGRAVYSFCMCPGGTVVAATSEPERVVTNGMSQYSRAERNANAGMVCAIEPSDYPQDAKSFAWAFDGKTFGVENQQPGEYHPLSGVVFQRQLESKAYLLGGRNYSAPGQLVGDFVAGKESADVGGVPPSYKPGITWGNLHHALPAFAIEAMREALPAFGKKIRGYDMHDAVLTGVETRTSSPVKIARGANFQSVNTQGLYPAGEGASYAGGILSAGVDGIKVGEAVAAAILGVDVPSSGMRNSGAY